MPVVRSSPIVAGPTPPAAPPVKPAPAGGQPREQAKRLSPSEQAVAAADPKNVYEIAGVGPGFDVGSAEEAAQVDRVTIDAQSDGATSTQFVVGTPAGVGGRINALAGQSHARKADFKLASEFTEAPEYGYAESGLPWRIFCEKTGNLMALVPRGPTRIGSEDGPLETRPEFRPTVETYYMDVTEVTLEQFDKYRQDAKSKKNSRVQAALNDSQDPQAPALGVPWGIALAFAHWGGKELPTEVEFEKAARGPEGFRTPWGNGRAIFGRLRTADMIANVGAFRTDQSVYGIFDLAGNAREWCHDFFSDTAHQEAKVLVGRRAQEWSGPLRPSVTGRRVVKGNGEDWSAWHREGRVMTERHADVGFRCVLRVKGAETAAAPASRN